MKIETNVNPRDLKNTSVKITTNIREITQGRLTKALVKKIKSKKGESSTVEEATQAGEGEPSNKSDWTGMLNAGTLDEVVQVLDSVTSIPEVQKKYKSIVKPARSAIKVYKSLAKLTRVYQKLAPKVTKIVKAAGVKDNPSLVADMAKDRLGKTMYKIIAGILYKLVTASINVILNYPIVITLSRDGVSTTFIQDLVKTFKKLGEDLIATLIAYVKDLVDIFTEFLEMLIEIDENEDISDDTEGYRQKATNFIRLDSRIPPKAKKDVIKIVQTLTLDEMIKALQFLQILNLNDVLSELSGAQVLALLEILEGMTDIERDKFLANLRRLSIAEILDVFASLNPDSVVYKSNLLNKFASVYREKERLITEAEEELKNSPLYIKLKTIPPEYLEELYNIFDEYLFNERFQFIAFMMNGNIKGLDNEGKNLLKNSIVESNEVDYQLIKIIILTILYGE